VDDDDNLYYAQIRGFLQDQYYEKSAVLTWLLPTKQSNKSMFNPATYILGNYICYMFNLNCLMYMPIMLFNMRINID